MTANICKACREKVKEGAQKCPHCGEILKPDFYSWFALAAISGFLLMLIYILFFI